MRVGLDFSATLLNRDHFSENQTFARKGAKFTKEAPGQISLPEIFLFLLLLYLLTLLLLKCFPDAAVVAGKNKITPTKLFI